MSNIVELDRRMLDFIAGLNTELSELVEGSNLYKSNISLNSVILPEAQKTLIINTVTSFEA